MKNALFTSWKTTTAGWIVGIIIIARSLAGITGAQVPALNADGTIITDDNGDVVTVAAESFDLEMLLLGLGILGIGTAARDNDKSSEAVKARYKR